MLFCLHKIKYQNHIWKHISLLYQEFIIQFSCDIATLWMVQSVYPSVRLSVCLFVCHGTYVPLIISSLNFPGWLPTTKVMSTQKIKVRGQGQVERGQDPTYLFSDRNAILNSHMAMKRCTELSIAQEKSPSVFIDSYEMMGMGWRWDCVPVHNRHLHVIITTIIYPRIWFLQDIWSNSMLRQLSHIQHNILIPGE